MRNESIAKLELLYFVLFHHHSQVTTSISHSSVPSPLHPLFPLLLPLCHNSRLTSVFSKTQVRAASQTYGSFRWRTEYCGIISFHAIVLPEIRQRSGLLLKQMLQTKPTSTTFRWQKHAARKSTPTAVGGTRYFRLLWSGRKPSMRY